MLFFCTSLQRSDNSEVTPQSLPCDKRRMLGEVFDCTSMLKAVTTIGRDGAEHPCSALR
jgi:hypothetical protein